MKEDMVNHPKHYASQFKTKTIECVDITRTLSFLRGNAFKYVWRSGMKGDKEKAIEDLDKAWWYLQEIRKLPWNPDSEQSLIAARAIFNCLEDNGDEKYKLLASILDSDHDSTAGFALREGYINTLKREFKEETV